ncbi:glycoside hydrolase family 47 protein [Aplosporella prunicola CBS 121167]|uniref:alpha-1,2-Mannosidase n=1 Tax=Aplosporella prunicola CBS 121167 TaxID=1176127 RepID=A0A6A6BWA5_9PEZI|nr:glycoside hydrolase family 47 protein [Aplosporella prunicola CBS 121167]KAF2147134.1 glycoside hydrolase family 47 protein [Aplosporella prunicola CBS 121167]
MLQPTLPRRKLLAAVIAFSIVFLLYHVPRLGAPASPPLPKVLPPGTAVDWAQVVHHYPVPVESLAALPTAAPASDKKTIPRLQHAFAESESADDRATRRERRDAVRDQFLHAWNGYKQHAWLRDEVRPVSGRAADPYGGWAATLVDALDTLWMMDLRDEFAEAVAAVEHIDFSRCTLERLNVFETTIRFLGGLLGAYDVSGGKYPSLLRKAEELGRMLYKAFDTPNRMPITRWDVMAAAAGIPQEADERVLVAELGSLSLEFTRLSQLTGDARYFDAIQRVAEAFAAHQASGTKLPGLWPVAVDARGGLNFSAGDVFTLGGMVDSLYEYLPKQHLLLRGAHPLYRQMWEAASTPLRKYLLFHPMIPPSPSSAEQPNPPILLPGDILSSGTHPPTLALEPRTQHLSCFAGGMFLLAGRLYNTPSDTDAGQALTAGCLWATEAMPRGIMPEIMYAVPCADPSAPCAWNDTHWRAAVALAADMTSPLDSAGDIAAAADALIRDRRIAEGVASVPDPRYQLRPEVVEAVFYAVRLAESRAEASALRDRAWKLFRNVVRDSRTGVAHAGLGDVRRGRAGQVDVMESFWLGETLKYFWLVFEDEGAWGLDEWVFTTEAHALWLGGEGDRGE